MPHRLTHAPDLPVLALRGMTRRRTPGAKTPTPAGAVRPSSSSTPGGADAASPAPRACPPSTSATYSLSTPVRRGWANNWSQGAVVSQNEQPFGALVQSGRPRTPGGSAGTRSSTRWARPCGIRRARDDPLGFVQQVIDQVGRHRQQDAVHFDPGRGHIDAPSENGHLAVDGDPAIGDHVLADAARADPRTSQHFLAAVRRPDSTASEAVGSDVVRTHFHVEAQLVGLHVGLELTHHPRVHGQEVLHRGQL